MKKVGVVLLWVFMSTLILSGCDSKTESKSSKVNNNEDSKKESKEKKSNKSSNQVMKEEKKELEEFNTEAVIKETVVVDAKGIKIIAKELTYNDYEAEVEIYIENNSKKDISVTAGSAGYSCNAINHFMLEDGYMNTDVPKGKKARDNVAFDIKSLQILGINKISDIYLAFSIEDDDYNEMYKGGKLIKTSLYEEDNNDTYLDIIKSGVLESEFGCEIINVNEENIALKNGVEIVSQTMLVNEDGDKSVFVELINNSKENRRVSLSDISINDINVLSGLYDSEYMIPNSRVIIEMTLNSLLKDDVAELISVDNVAKVSYIFELHNDEFVPYFTSKTIDYNISDLKDKKSKDKNKSAVDKVVYDKNNVIITYNGVKADEEDESYKFIFMIENKRRGTINCGVSDDSVAIDGFMIDVSCYGKELKSKTKGVFEFSLGYDELDDNDIGEIKEIEVGLDIYNDMYDVIAKPKFKLDVSSQL